MRSGTDIFNSLPRTAGPAREQAILAAVTDGDVVISWVDVTSQVGGHTATFSVSADALRLGSAGDSFRASATARTMQQIADALGCVLPTSRMCDLIWAQAAVQLAPCPQNVDDATRVSTALMGKYHAQVEALLAGRTGLIENVGKHWVLSSSIVGVKRAGIQAAANYGFYSTAGEFKSGPKRDGLFPLMQPLATDHFVDYTDYSQVIRLVKRACTVDGQDADLSAVLTESRARCPRLRRGRARVRADPGALTGAPLTPRAPASPRRRGSTAPSPRPPPAVNAARARSGGSPMGPSKDVRSPATTPASMPCSIHRSRRRHRPAVASGSERLRLRGRSLDTHGYVARGPAITPVIASLGARALRPRGRSQSPHRAMRRPRRPGVVVGAAWLAGCFGHSHRAAAPHG